MTALTKRPFCRCPGGRRDETTRHQKSAKVSENRFFTQITDTLALDDGGSYDYHYFDCNFDAVVVVPILPNGKLLVESIYRHPYGRYVYEFPAGGIEEGEDPCVAGGRELTEETGYIASSLTPLQSFEAMPGLMKMRLHFVLASGLAERRRIAA